MGFLLIFFGHLNCSLLGRALTEQPELFDRHFRPKLRSINFVFYKRRHNQGRK